MKMIITSIALTSSFLTGEVISAVCTNALQFTPEADF